MEWGHRVLGRLIGLTFVAPLAYFASRKVLAPPMTRNLLFLGLLIGFQGALGWYMVKSGLEDSIIETGSVPRVSQYRSSLIMSSEAPKAYFCQRLISSSAVKETPFAAAQEYNKYCPNYLAAQIPSASPLSAASPLGDAVSLRSLCHYCYHLASARYSRTSWQ